ncbi:MAG: hypothetical protein NWT08_14670 [Akkermansiaceae bacterium]|jgi:hypothetical protein|nr:hypothetical protein [Akkermansiaceae bacterium]MDP4646650.1 hypothetical protein [Akkermansiaceae bacterium]MDP4721140.1 hypothetical protein [Akkermansiaceae bacterium]MDP4846354.1 hypothetical protein [Akkermansiaceae bacterium]MDP4996078.1 hypothetical protein [Akkermansiaceae bacterium]
MYHTEMKRSSIFALSFLISFSFTRAEEDPFAYIENEAEKAISKAESRFFDAKSKLQSDYRVDLAKAIAKGDQIEIYLLDFEMEDTRSDFLFWDTRLEDNEFPIIPYGCKSEILKRVKLTVEQQKTFLPKLQHVVGVPGEVDGGAACHFPIHGVRIFSGERIIFQSSFCWKCQNFAISYPDSPSWVGISEGDLFAAFCEIMPIPQSEIDRFDAQFKKEATDPESE